MGKMGRIRAQTIEASPHATLAAICDPSDSALDARPGVLRAVDYRDVLDSDVDAVFVCTPNCYTARIVCDALGAGKHVFSEKPPGVSMDDIERIREAERRHAGLTLKFGFNHRYHAGIQEAKRIIDSGRLGQILWLRGIYGKSGGAGFESSWRSERQYAGGGILLDQGIHMLDLFRHFCGDFEDIKSMVATRHWKIEVEDNAFALLRDRQGRIAMLHSSSTQWKHRFNLEIYLSDGYLSVNGILTSTRSYGDETLLVARKQFDDGFAVGRPREESIFFDTDPSWDLELNDFLACIRDGKPVESGNSLDAYKAMQMVFAIYENDERWREAAGPRS
ncbi:MAG: 1,5-anhydro-D-fructose reductase [candidate division BRC1 bacterium ADurb.BinA364]|nr:MAG: 1,5-anhydro-D-fructose reductase [candidate division BRC1 bacterium ADurb.BinA364]